MNNLENVSSKDMGKQGQGHISLKYLNLLCSVYTYSSHKQVNI